MVKDLAGRVLIGFSQASGFDTVGGCGGRVSVRVGAHYDRVI